MITCEWTILWELLADCTEKMPDYCSADVFTSRHISSYNMVQFECLSTCVQCSHSTCVMLWHVVMPPIARGQPWLCQPLPVSTVPNTLSNSNYRGLDGEEFTAQCPRLWECYLHAIYRQLLSLLYSTQGTCDTKTFVLSTVRKYTRWLCLDYLCTV